MRPGDLASMDRVVTLILVTRPGLLTVFDVGLAFVSRGSFPDQSV